jgi:coenzyme F420-dependent glucose-6-phosphate dehydrogenase
LSFSDDYDRAFESAKFWRATLIKDVFISGISDPRKLEQKAKKEVADKQLKKSIQIVTSIEDSNPPPFKEIKSYFPCIFFLHRKS